MARYIDADNLTEEIKSLSVFLGGNNVFNKTAKESVLRVIGEQPTAKVEKVRHGYWTVVGRTESRSNILQCSVCGKVRRGIAKTAYCKDCGAKMDGGKAE